MKINGTTELSKAVAEHVMGECWHEWDDYVWGRFQCKKCDEEVFHTGIPRNGAHYATDANAALEVWENTTRIVQIEKPTVHTDGKWLAVYGNGINYPLQIKAPTFPEAICVAALRSVGIEVEYTQE